MPLVAPLMVTQIAAALVSKGFIGVNTPLLAQALGLGSVLSLVGKPFSTTDTGSGPSAGVGVGVGLQGVSAGALKTLLLTSATSKGLVPTPQLQDLFGAYADALVAQLALATLTSAHTPVFVGSGTIVGGITVPAPAWASAIQSQAPTFVGTNWPVLCSVFGEASSQAMLTATGTVVISGPPPPTPAPAVGQGTGTIT
jgi:hypothetical protein